MNFQANRERLSQVGPDYQEVCRTQRVQILEEFVAATGYARTYAIRLLSGPAWPPAVIQRPGQPRYGADVHAALRRAWEAANGTCSKRLVPFLPEFVPVVERHG